MHTLIRKVNLHIALLLAVGLALFLIKCNITYRIKYVGHADAAALFSDYSPIFPDIRQNCLRCETPIPYYIVLSASIGTLLPDEGIERQ